MSQPFVSRLLHPFALAVCVLLAGCASEINPTAAPWYLDDAVPAPKRVIMANVHWPPPPLDWVEAAWSPVDDAVFDRMRTGGVDVIRDDALFEDAWRTAMTRHGEYFDPRRGRVDEERFGRVLFETAQRLAEHGIDGIVFTQSLIRQVPVSGGQRRVLRFDGVQRRPLLRGNEVPVDFDWLSHPVRTASVMVHLVTTQGVRFRGLGGIEAIETLDLRTGSGKTRRIEDPLNTSSFIDEGVALALHPLVRYSRHPLAR